LSLCSQKYGFEIRDTGSGKNLFRIPDPGFKKAPDPGSVKLTDPDPTPFFSDFKDAKKNFFTFFLKTYPQAHYLQSLIYWFKDNKAKSFKTVKIYVWI
jgi:hypothetical protein